jgi:hypothetical protein
MATVNVNPPALTTKQITRFWKYVDKTPGQGPKGECWRWARTVVAKYGRFSVCIRGKKRAYTTHRLSFFLAMGYWPALYVLHECDWQLCCNPAHLFEGTAKQNYDDAAAKGRATKGEKTGTSKLTAPEVLEIRRLVAAGVRRVVVAERFNISSSHVTLIVQKKKSWTHI